ncbi:MAG: transposase [Deltaproteobacteria bacterium]|nr:transposase [Deltaproteobacteria bacterium]
MPRCARVSTLGQPHLISARANTGSKLFYNDDDYESYLEHLIDLASQEIINLYGFCLHPKELRLLLTPKHFSISRVMQRLNGSHTRRINQRRSRRGALFNGRFESKLLEEDQVIEILRNIHLWPVRKGLSRRPESYSWSSHRAYLGLENDWEEALSSHAIFEYFSDSLNVSRKAFARYIESAALESEVPTLGMLETSAPNKSKFKRRLSLSALAKRIGLLLNIEAKLLSSNSRRQELVMGRRLFATTAVKNAGWSITGVAYFLNRDKAQVSRLVSQGIELFTKNESFRVLINSI